MKVGDKVYSQSKKKDVLIVDIMPSGYQVYDEATGYYGVVSKSDLLEYETRVTRPTGRPAITTKPTKIEGRNEKMNIRKLFSGFGKVQAGEVALTFDGKVAIRRKDGDYVRFDEEKNQIVNNMELVFDSASKFLYILPVQTVAKGDIIKYKDKFYQVVEPKDTGICAVNLSDGTRSTICKETNAFGFNFYYKVTSLFNTDGGSAITGIDPTTLMLLSKKDGKFDDLLPLLMLGNTELTKNPLLLMSLVDGASDMKDILMLQAFSGQSGTTANLLPLLLMGEGKSDISDILMLQAFAGKGAEGGVNPLALALLSDK